ncbi:MAG: taurine transport system ATP-binding protein [Frankiaceae bacterium]|nr:taurine transport system ATP-binding protein [Frankiaceae bacterium]MDQ1727721.1 taurine transport system ATP-binding protein [Frankiaceae bacterium]
MPSADTVSPAVGGGDSPSPDGARVVIDRVSHAYGRGPAVLRGIDLTIGSDEFVAVLGPSGCGKSTLLRLVAGLEQPTAGRVLIDGAPPVAGRGVGVVFQQPRLFPWRTVAGNVSFGLRGRSSDALVTEALRRVGLDGLGERRTWQLSGGQQQRVALARTLVLRPHLLLMDEPFAALDAITRERLQDRVRTVAIEERIPTIFVTHSVDEAVLLASRVLVLAPGGTIVADVTVPLPRTGTETGDELRAAPTFVARRRELAAALTAACGT